MAQELSQTDQDLGELENRLERLRVLYEQYFMGIEKREPGVQRKDVERRIQQLRRVRFQSTALRFKFQTTVQRFNTLQQYWNRTCREIDNGTYRRHVLRAQRRLATDPPADATSEETQERAASAAEAREAAAADLAALLDEDVDLEAEMQGALAALERPDTNPAPSLKDLGKRTAPNRPHTSPTLHLGKVGGLKKRDSDASPSISPRHSVSPKPKGLADLKKRSPTDNPLAKLSRAEAAERKAAPAPTKLSPANPAPAKPAPAKPAPANPAPAKPAAAPPPRKAGPPPAPSMRPRPAAARDALSRERIQAIHASYLEARKKTNASAVSLEKLEKNIRDTEKKLREKHKGRQVDFDVSIKDGKAILKPKLK